MLASTPGLEDAKDFRSEKVGNQSYLNRHNSQIFTDGLSFSGNERDKLYLNRGDGSFADVSDLSGCDSPNDGRAVLANDFDDDGDVDLFVHHLQRERHTLYRNDAAPAGQFVKVRLEATTGQWEGIGSTVVATVGERKLAQVLSRGAGFVSCLAPELVFGTGSAKEIALEVRWPGGTSESFGNVPAGSRVLLVEGTGKPQSFEARGVAFADPRPQGLRIDIGTKLPPLEVFDATGKSVTLDAAELADGERLLLNFWATWCASCVAELPLLDQRDQSSDERVVGINLDLPGEAARATKFLSERASFDTWFLPDVRQGSLHELIDFDRLPTPTTLIVSPEGILVDVITGPI